jgi:hypothetical protein
VNITPCLGSSAQSAGRCARGRGRDFHKRRRASAAPCSDPAPSFTARKPRHERCVDKLLGAVVATDLNQHNEDFIKVVSPEIKAYGPRRQQMTCKPKTQKPHEPSLRDQLSAHFLVAFEADFAANRVAAIETAVGPKQ